MAGQQWAITRIKEWVESQTGPNCWYQTISIKDGIVTPGMIDPTRRLRMLALPDDLSGQTVLDVGCNSGLLCFECKKRNASRMDRINSKIMAGWSLVPDRQFLDSVMGEQFKIRDLGMSSRYNLFRLTRKK